MNNGLLGVPNGITKPDGKEKTLSFLNQSSDIELKFSDAGSYIVILGTKEIDVKLPDAKKLQNNKSFVIKNDSPTFTINVYDFDNRFLFNIFPLRIKSFWLESQNTTAGRWVVDSYPQAFDSEKCLAKDVGSFSSSIVSKATGSNFFAAGGNGNLTELTSTTALLIYQEGNFDNTPRINKAVVVTNTAGTITYGTPFDLPSGFSTTAYGQKAVALSATSVLVGGISNGNNNAAYVILTISGTTITGAGSVVNDTAIGPFACFTPLSATTCLVFGGLGSVRFLTISGTTITLGGTAAAPAGLNSVSDACTLTSTSAFVAYQNTNGSVGNIVVTTSGTTPSYNSAIEVANSSTTGRISVSTLTSTSVLVSYDNISNNSDTLYVATISGTTITANAVVSAPKQPGFTSSRSNDVVVEAFSSTSGVLLYQNSTTGVNAAGFTISGTTITFGTLLVLKTDGIQSRFFSIRGLQTPSINTPSATTALISYNGPNFTTQVLSLSGSTVSLTGSNTIRSSFVYNRDTASQESDFRPVLTESLSTGRALVLYQENSSTGGFQLVARLIDYTNKVPIVVNSIVIATNHVPQGVASSGTPSVRLVALSATLAIAAYNTAQNVISARAISITGDTLAVGAAVTVGTGNTGFFLAPTGLCFLSATSALFTRVDTINGANAMTPRVLSVSGTTITANADGTGAAALSTGSNVLLQFSTTKFVHNGNIPQVITVSGTTVTTTPTTSFSPFGGESNIVLSSTRFLTVSGSGSGGFSFVTYNTSADHLTNALVSSLTLGPQGDSFSDISQAYFNVLNFNFGFPNFIKAYASSSTKVTLVFSGNYGAPINGIGQISERNNGINSISGRSLFAADVSLDVNGLITDVKVYPISSPFTQVSSFNNVTTLLSPTAIKIGGQPVVVYDSRSPAISPKYISSDTMSTGRIIERTGSVL